MRALKNYRNRRHFESVELSREIERAVQFDDGLAAKAHLAAGRAIYYGDPLFPGQIVKEYPDGRRQLVNIDEKSVVTVIKDDLMILGRTGETEKIVR